VRVGTKSLFHLHRDSDEVAWELAGEITFMIGEEISVGGPGTCAFLPRNVPRAWKNSGSVGHRGGTMQHLLDVSRPHWPACRRTPRGRGSARSCASATTGKSSVPIRCESLPMGGETHIRTIRADEIDEGVARARRFQQRQGGAQRWIGEADRRAGAE
jgi:hypothetical protein